MEFGTWLRINRINRNITLGQLSEQTGISVAYLSRLEHGVRINPSRAIIDKIRNVFKEDVFHNSIIIPSNVIDIKVIIGDKLLSIDEKVNLQKFINKIIL